MSTAKSGISNSGSIYGTYAGQLLYLHEMASWYIPTYNRSMLLYRRVIDPALAAAVMQPYHYQPNISTCIDQGLQSYLMFTGAFDRLFLAAYTAGKIGGGVGYLFDETGPVRTVVLSEPYACAEFDAEGNVTRLVDGRVVNSIGKVAAVVHTFDRWCEATLQNAWLLGSSTASAAALNRGRAQFGGGKFGNGPVFPVRCSNV